jgi:hypothetical protein
MEKRRENRRCTTISNNSGYLEMTVRSFYLQLISLLLLWLFLSTNTRNLGTPRNFIIIIIIYIIIIVIVIIIITIVIIIIIIK